MRSVRIAWRCTALIVHGIVGVAIQLVGFPFMPAHVRASANRRWSRICLAICGVGLDARGPDGDTLDPELFDGCLILANHVSWLDIVVLNAIRPSHFVAKSEIRRWPLMGTLATRSGTIYIERGRRHAVHDVIRQIVERLRANDVCTVFPEGTTGDGSALLPFHANLTEAALEAQAPVAPLTLRYLDGGASSARAAFVGDDTLLDSMVKVLGAPGLVARVDAAALIGPPHGGTRHTLTALARDRIAAPLWAGAPNGYLLRASSRPD